MEWKPINTIPECGEVLVWSEYHGWNVVEADNTLEPRGGGQPLYFNGDVYVIATHWTELTRPPQ